MKLNKALQATVFALLQTLITTIGIAANLPPIATIIATPTMGSAPLISSLSALGSKDPEGGPLTYKWTFGDGTSGIGPSFDHVYSKDGIYTATVVVTDNQGNTGNASVVITVGNTAPFATIETPLNGDFYYPGSPIILKGFGSDHEQGKIIDTAKVKWTVLIHNKTHVYAFPSVFGINTVYPAPQSCGDANVFLEIRLEITDNGGLKGTTSVFLFLDKRIPIGVNLIANSNLSVKDATTGAPLHWAFERFYTNDGKGKIVPGPNGVNALQCAITSYTSGDAKWSPDNISVIPNKTYLLEFDYLATGTTDLMGRYTGFNEVVTYVKLESNLPATNGVWKHYAKKLTTPIDTDPLHLDHMYALFKMYITSHKIETTTIANMSIKRTN